MRMEVRMMALNMLIVECEMFAAHTNNLGRSALTADQSLRDGLECAAPSQDLPDVRRRISEQRVIIGTSSHLILDIFFLAR